MHFLKRDLTFLPAYVYSKIIDAIFDWSIKNGMVKLVCNSF